MSAVLMLTEGDTPGAPALPPYDLNGRCSKCHGWEVATRWVPPALGAPHVRVVVLAISGKVVEVLGERGKDDAGYPGDYDETRRLDPREHLLRRCERCGYSWAEAPVAGGDDDPGLAWLPSDAQKVPTDA